MLIFIIFLIYGAKFNFLALSGYQVPLARVFIYFPLMAMWGISSLAETNRTPFDFSEGESELVSGFNIEYSRGGFALLFLGEYARIIFISFLLSLIFIGTKVRWLFYFISVYFVFGFI